MTTIVLPASPTPCVAKPERIMLGRFEIKDVYRAKEHDSFLFDAGTDVGLVKLTAISHKGCKRCFMLHLGDCASNVACVNLGASNDDGSMIFADDDTLVDIVSKKLFGKNES